MSLGSSPVKGNVAMTHYVGEAIIWCVELMRGIHRRSQCKPWYLQFVLRGKVKWKMSAWRDPGEPWSVLSWQYWPWWTNGLILYKAMSVHLQVFSPMQTLKWYSHFKTLQTFLAIVDLMQSGFVETGTKWSWHTGLCRPWRTVEATGGEISVFYTCYGVSSLIWMIGKYWT